MAAGSPASRGAAGSWVRLDLVENTAEGPAFDRCEFDGVLKGRQVLHSRFLYGEVRKGTGPTWEAVRSRSGCAGVPSGTAPDPWTLRATPYLLADVDVVRPPVSGIATSLQVSLRLRRLVEFTENGAPSYEKRTMSVKLQIPPGRVGMVPLLIANERETETFGLRELLLRVRTSPTNSPSREYGEIEISSDVPLATILLDGGAVGRTLREDPVLLNAVPTGPQEIVVIDPSGREVRASAQVERDRRSSLALALLPHFASSGPAGLRALGKNPQGGEEFWRDKDGAIVVRVPGGEFQMGSPGETGEPAERPQHSVRVGGLLMDKTEVTWGQYRRFAVETGRALPPAPVWGQPESFPATNVTWEEAHSFCSWAGGRLPTEAEWELAARGRDGRLYPWGGDWDPARCNTQEGGPHAPTAAASYPGCVSADGLLDLAGSVWEWCQDWYDPTYYARSPVENPSGPETGPSRVSRGGSWVNPSSWVRAAMRQGIDPAWPDPTRGFRCAMNDPARAAQ